MSRPFIGLTADFVDGYARLRRTYLDVVEAAGGIPIILPPKHELRREMLDRMDGIILTGGDDIDVSQFGIALHAKAQCMASERQASEFALLRELDARPEIPVLGICLGMQMMGVHRGAVLIQHLADVLPHADRHGNDAIHDVESDASVALGSGAVRSWHHQALADAKGFEIVSRSDDGVIEGILDSNRRFYLGVQWHPERTETVATGLDVVRLLVTASR